MVDTVIINLPGRIASTILKGFDRHFSIFSKITKGARSRFENADWDAERKASRSRIEFYDTRVRDATRELQHIFALDTFNGALWFEVKREYIQLIQNHLQPELAETFYNSVFCAVFHRAYFDNDYIFIRSAVSTEFIHCDKPSYHVYYPARRGFRSSIRQLLIDGGFELPFEHLERDVRNITRALIRQIFTGPRCAFLNFQFQVISALFYRNKAAYIVGKCINSNQQFPFAIPVLHGASNSLYADTVILGTRGLSRLFGFSYVYFMVDHPVPSSIVAFLRNLMPTRSKESLYSAIGFHKQGKTDFYRDFLDHLKHSEDDFIFAPGIKGLVMAVFTLPSYPYVFKIIRDRFAPPKKVTRERVLGTYRLVKQHDRVGRMSDTLEYSYVALPRDRFSEDLLTELRTTCAKSVSEEEAYIIIKHVYIERRMTPLNIAVKQADDAYLDRLMKGYGEAIKELAAANIFPGDLLMKNFGVTGRVRGRIVFYDYDEICYLTECRFRKIPPPRYVEDAMSSEPWYSIAANDIFPEQFSTFLFADNRTRQAFLKHHRDLLDANFWIEKQDNINAGKYEMYSPTRKASVSTARNRAYRKTMTIQAILFDHDGTLVDSEAEHFAMWLEILKTHAVALSLQQYKKFHAGLSTETNATRLIKQFKLSISPIQLAEQKNRATIEFLSKSAFPLIPGVRDTVTSLFNCGYKLGAVTGAGRESLENTVKVHGLRKYFSTLVCKNDVRHGKPAPDCYLLALQQLNLKPSEALAIEDTEHGLSAATSAGIDCLVIPNAMSRHHDFGKALKIFADINQAREWVLTGIK